MKKLLLKDFDNFNKITTIPLESINSKIEQAIKELDEKVHIEPSIRKILYDPNQTPHGPTEIADIITIKTTINGRPKLTAFVIKGRSFKKITAKEITHQFTRLRDIPDLDVAVFVAIGDIQDDAKKEFYRVCEDGSLDSLEVDRRELARLLIAYGKICPNDGTFLDKEHCPKCGFSGIQEETHFEEEQRPTTYGILALNDISTARAKRYSADILINQKLKKEEIEETIRHAVEDIKSKEYYRNNLVKSRWQNTQANVVWLYIYQSLEDHTTTNWICRTLWIDPRLDDNYRPFAFNSGQLIEDIEVDWNDNFDSFKKWYEDHRADKGQFLDIIDDALKKVHSIMVKIKKITDDYETKNLGSEEYISIMKSFISPLNDLMHKSSDWPFPPFECKSLDSQAQSLISHAHNVSIPFSDQGLNTWEESNRMWIVKKDINNFFELYPNVEFLRKNIT
jgi:hypothetical protein